MCVAVNIILTVKYHCYSVKLQLIGYHYLILGRNREVTSGM